nr:MAG TPA: hypothetical protein [Caudoviricetes sp.]
MMADRSVSAGEQHTGHSGPRGAAVADGHQRLPGCWEGPEVTGWPGIDWCATCDTAWPCDAILRAWEAAGLHAD